MQQNLHKQEQELQVQEQDKRERAFACVFSYMRVFLWTPMSIIVSKGGRTEAWYIFETHPRNDACKKSTLANLWM